MLRALAAALTLLPVSAWATPPADPFLRLDAQTRGFRAGQPEQVTPLPGGREALFLRSGPRSGTRSLLVVDLSTGVTRVLADAESLQAGGAGISEAEKARLERQRITSRGITHFQVAPGGGTVLVRAGGGSHLVDPRTGQHRPLPLPDGAIDPRFSPDGRSVAFVAGGELHVLDVATGTSRQLTRGATEWKTHGLAEFVAQEEMDRHEGYWWSPDAASIAFQESDDEAVEKLSISDPTRPERAPVRFAYPRAGKQNTRVRLGVVPVAGGDATWIEWDRDRYPYLARVRWDRGGPLLLLVQDRAQREEVVLRADPATGKTATLLVERDPAWLNLHAAAMRGLPDGSGFLWFTERNGGAELELRGPDGSLRRSLVPPEWGFTALVGVDPRDGTVTFLGTRGDPTQEWLYRVKPGGAPEEVAMPVGRPAEISARLAEDGSALAVTSRLPGQAARVAVYAPDGQERAVVPSVAEAPPFRSRPEVRQVGARRLWTSLVRPRDFRPGGKYPVVVDVYGGPTHFTPLRLRGGSPRQQWLADQGFLVVSVINRGQTARAGRAFERAIQGDFAGPALEDQVEALRALAAEVPEMDLSRVAIRGWSFGGYMAALAALARPDVYRAAISGAPVVDWLDYDTHYTERYLGIPDAAPEAYRRSSLLPRVKAGGSPILLVHGTADDNVYFLHSLKLADGLFRAGAPTTFAPIAGATHLVADPATAEALAGAEVRFLREHLGAGPAP